eukprot:TRINITY_DN18558_c1_g3_i2.p1 TRINITY_DN18558_c1_g3~~TRINITY_DN18558_c1_g3_i2.p1  ORF type:complete len:187 (-),score=29.90 TRINITY_DN18558_c1_g3_i2:146-706(-)
MISLLDILETVDVNGRLMGCGLDSVETVLQVRGLCSRSKLVMQGADVKVDFVASGKEVNVLEQLQQVQRRVARCREKLHAAPSDDTVRICHVTIAQKAGGMHVKGRPFDELPRRTALQDIGDILASQRELVSVMFCSLDGWDCIGGTVAARLGLRRTQAGWREIRVGASSVRVHHTEWTGPHHSTP